MLLNLILVYVVLYVDAKTTEPEDFGLIMLYIAYQCLSMLKFSA